MILNIPPPESLAEFPEKVQSVNVGEEYSVLYIPPPESLTGFPVKVQLVNVGEDW